MNIFPGSEVEFFQVLGPCAWESPQLSAFIPHLRSSFFDPRLTGCWAVSMLCRWIVTRRRCFPGFENVHKVDFGGEFEKPAGKPDATLTNPATTIILFMRCPNCGKGGFASHDAVSRHMGQPKSGCSTWFNDLVRIREDLLSGSHHGSNDLCTTSIDEPPGGREEPYESRVGGDEQMLDGHQDENFQASSINYFPGAAQTYNGGSTFINKFDTDEFSNQRTSNIYYPFASRGDWKLGSWLLHSGLSMGAINAFLSLSLVCFLLDYQLCYSQ